VIFNEPVSDFATGDMTLSGTAGATTATVTGSGTTYNVAVSGMTGDGTVIATLLAGVAHDTAGNDNTASTSTDNTVAYDGTPQR
jgi:serine protease AprX